MCEADESSREHVPPRCLFPNAKDFGSDERKNLITVPSCDQHNSGKSKDDEYLRAALTMMSGPASAPAEYLFFAKVLKAARRKPDGHMRFFSRGVLLPSGETAVQLSRLRFDGCIDRLVRALYFHTFGTKWQHKTVVVSPGFYLHDDAGRLTVPEETHAAKKLTQEFLGAQRAQGENPSVFLYKIHQEGEFLGFASLFYQSVEIYVASSPALEAMHNRDLTSLL
jgi:hypothetical protein